MQTMGGIFDAVGDWFSNTFGSGGTDYTKDWENITGSSGASAGFGGDWGSSISPYLSYNNQQYMTQEDYWWKQYGSQGGVLPYESSTPSTTSNNNFFGDVASGAGDFFNGVTSALSGLTGLFNQGAQAYFNVQQAINAMNPQDQIVVAPGSNQPFIRRDGQLIPLTTLYPQLQGQVAAAQKSQQTQTLLLVGALGLGLFFILKDKKKK